MVSDVQKFDPAQSLLKNIKAAMGALIILGGAGVVMTVVNPPLAQAQTQVQTQVRASKSIVDAAKSQGLIGETVSGYLVPVSDASITAGVRNAMNEINIGRKSVYTRLARQQNLSVEVVAALTGEKQIAKAASGQKILDRSGQWRTK